MDKRDLAQALVGELRKYMREETPQNNIIAIPATELLRRAGPSLPPGTSGNRSDMEGAMDVLKDAKICEVVKQQTQTGALVPMLRMTSEGRGLTDDAIAARLFPERN